MQELGFDARSTRGARQGVVDEEIERLIPVDVRCVSNNRDNFSSQAAIIDRFGVQTLLFAGGDLFAIFGVKAHDRSPKRKFLRKYFHRPGS